MATTSTLILDTWAPLNHKTPMVNLGANAATDGFQGMAPTWVREHRRRLTAYTVLAGYIRNNAREWLADADPDRRSQHREYGDAELIVQSIRAAVLGAGATLSIARAGDDDRPRPTAEDVDDAEDAPTLEELIAEWEADQAEIIAARDRQEWLDQWLRSERGQLKIIEAENNAVSLGDGVYVLSRDGKGRVRLRTYDPGFYFPAVDYDGGDDEYPTRVHLAWEWEDADGVTFIRRRTWELVDLEGTRPVPYQDDPAEQTVLHTDADWRKDDLTGDFHVDAMPDEHARYRANDRGEEIKRLDLEIDFIPVVHVPNTINLAEGWGESSLLRIAQLLDDIAATDTDIAGSAAVTGAPVIAVSGRPPGSDTNVTTYGPGQLFWTGDGGRMQAVDVSSGLTALGGLLENLLNRLSVNRQLPESILGRVDATDAPSGIALLLSFGPFRQLIEDMRLAREDKYALLVKFVQRLAVTTNDIDEVLDGTMEFGSFLPTDLDTLKDLVLELIAGHVLSRATGLRLLRDAGLDIDNLDDELRAARAEDLSGAGELADATGSEALAKRYLGVEEDAGDTTGEPATEPSPTATEPSPT